MGSLGRRHGGLAWHPSDLTCFSFPFPQMTSLSCYRRSSQRPETSATRRCEQKWGGVGGEASALTTAAPSLPSCQAFPSAWALVSARTALASFAMGFYDT